MSRNHTIQNRQKCLVRRILLMTTSITTPTIVPRVFQNRLIFRIMKYRLTILEEVAQERINQNGVNPERYHRSYRGTHYYHLLKVSYFQAFLDGGNTMSFDSNMTAEEARFMVLNYYVKHRLTQKALVDLLKMINLMAGSEIFPECYETFNASFPDPYKCSRVYYCTECQCGIGTSSKCCLFNP